MKRPMRTKTLPLLSLALAGLLAAGCTGVAPYKPDPIVLRSTFDEAEALRLLQPGRNTIKGSALVLQQGGGTVTCAGREVSLYPETSYTYERMLHVYGMGERGMRGVRAPLIEWVPPTPPGYEKARRTTRCDAQGFFTFGDVGDGTYRVVTLISWFVGPSPNGAALMHRVTVEGGQTRDVVLAP